MAYLSDDELLVMPRVASPYGTMGQALIGEIRGAKRNHF